MSDPETKLLAQEDLRALLAAHDASEEAPTRILGPRSSVRSTPADDPATAAWLEPPQNARRRLRKLWDLRWALGLAGGLVLAGYCVLAYIVSVDARGSAREPNKVTAAAAADRRKTGPDAHESSARSAAGAAPCLLGAMCATESAALELVAADYLASGRKREALEVYRALAAREPEDAVYPLIVRALGNEVEGDVGS